MTRARVLAVCRVAALLPNGDDGAVTAIDKRPVDGAVKVGRYGLVGDVQAERAYHGGPDKAVFLIDQAEIDYWQGELGRELPFGAFGENLRTQGEPIDHAVIGERWRIGGQLVVEVTQPRTPCLTFQRRIGQPDWIRRYTERGRPGVYVRVLTPGEVCAGDEITTVSTPAHGVTLSAWFGDRSAEHAAALLDSGEDCWDLAGNLRTKALRAAGR